MRVANIAASTTIDTTLPPTSDPMYQSAALALELRQTLKNLNDNGFVLQQAEASDYVSIDNQLDSYLTAMSSWIDSLPAAPAEGGSRAIPTGPTPSVPDIVGPLSTLALAGVGGVPAILMRIAIEVGVRLLESWLEGKVYAGQDPSTGEIVDVLNNLFKGPDGESVAELVEKGLIDKNALGEKFAIMWALSKQQQRIVVSNRGDVDDVLIEDTHTP